MYEGVIFGIFLKYVLCLFLVYDINIHNLKLYLNLSNELTNLKKDSLSFLVLPEKVI
jgi:hypothetical protein